MPMNALTAAVERDRRAVEATRTALVDWSPGAADRPTPCAGWTLRDLLAHMTVQQRGFARAVAGERTVLADWAPVIEDDPMSAYAASCDAVLAAFAALTDPDAPVLLPEIRDEPLPTILVVGFHLVDNVVHAWDVAATFGNRPALDADLLAAGLAVARAVPDDERRDQDGAAFARSLPVDAGADPLDEILLLLGRDPSWSPG